MNRLLFLLAIFFAAIISNAQAPQKMSYQAVIRNSSNALVASSPVGMQISIIQGSPTGTVVYSETQTPSTNANGLATLEIGTGVVVSGAFASINWANGPYYLMTETDPAGGTSYSITGTMQLMSVPYALYAETAGNAGTDSQTLSVTGDSISISGGNTVALPSNNGGKTIIILSGDITDSQAAAKIASDYGVNTQEVLITNTTLLTTVDLSMISTLYTLTVTDNSALTSIDFSNLQVLEGASELTNNPLLDIQMPMLQKTYGNFSISNAANTTVSFPLLTNCRSFVMQSCANATTLSFASLTKLNNLYVANNSVLSTINMPALITVNTFNINTSGAIISLSFPSLTTAGTFQVNANNMTSISTPNLSSVSQYDMSMCSLTSASVDAILVDFVNVLPAITGAYINLANQLVAAPPTATGAAAKATLSVNNTVYTD
jgi:hypothetical protein